MIVFLEVDNNLFVWLEFFFQDNCMKRINVSKRMKDLCREIKIYIEF